jgi:hypothetical protein
MASLLSKFKSYPQLSRYVILFCRQSKEAYNCPLLNTGTFHDSAAGLVSSSLGITVNLKAECHPVESFKIVNEKHD